MKKTIFLIAMIAMPLLGSSAYANGSIGWHGNNGWHQGWNRAPDWHYGDGVAYGAPYYYGDFQYDYVPGMTPSMDEYNNNSGPMLYDSENTLYFNFTPY